MPTPQTSPDRGTIPLKRINTESALSPDSKPGSRSGPRPDNSGDGHVQSRSAGRSPRRTPPLPSSPASTSLPCSTATPSPDCPSSPSPAPAPPPASPTRPFPFNIPIPVPSGLGPFWCRNKGPILVLVSTFFGLVMAASTSLLEKGGRHPGGPPAEGMHALQILFLRNSITVILSFIFMKYKHIPHSPLGPAEVRPHLLARGVAGFFGVFGFYYSLQYLPVADATVITFLSPSISCWACSYILNEPFTTMEQLGTMVSLVGVVLIARPTFIFHLASHNDNNPKHGQDGPVGERGLYAPGPTSSLGPDGTFDTSGSNSTIPSAQHPPPSNRAAAVGVAMVGVLGAASAYTLIRWIGKRAHPLITVTYSGACTGIVSAVLLLAVPTLGFRLPRNWDEWGFLLALGVSGFAKQFLLASGLRAEKSSRATNMLYVQMPLAMMADKVVFDTSPKWLSLAGSVLILGSTIYVASWKGAGPSDEPASSPAYTRLPSAEAQVPDGPQR